MTLQEALDSIIGSYKPFDVLVRNCPDLDAKEIDDALKAAAPDSEEAVALSALAVVYPYTAPAPSTSGKSKTTTPTT